MELLWIVFANLGGVFFGMYLGADVADRRWLRVLAALSLASRANQTPENEDVSFTCQRTTELVASLWRDERRWWRP
jgi:hypothetical protein